MTNPRRFDGRLPSHLQYSWASDVVAALEVAPGEELEVDLHDSSTGQLGPDSTVEDLRRLDLARVDAVAGPIAIQGAEPGDALDVEILEIQTAAWGWSGVFRNFGLLRDRFDDDLVTWSVQSGFAKPTRGFLRTVSIPTASMIGSIGVAPEAGRFGLIPPERFGGNMDHRHHGAGAVLTFPVFRPGGLLSLGDPHAAQGDGEVCGTGIETPARVRLRFHVRRGEAPPFPRVSGNVPAEPSEARVDALGIGPSLEFAARAALENLLEWLVAEGWDEKEAYLLASVCGNLRIAEAVDMPNFVVVADFPTRLLRPPS